MTLRVYNTLSRKKEVFEPVEPGKVRMYVCGPTVYDSCHIGHARSVVVFDVIVRYLRAIGLEVTYIRNFTDVDDKIIDRAHRLKTDPMTVARKYIDEFYTDMDALNVLRPDSEPRVTQFIGPITMLVQRLIDRGMAYEADGDVYFSVEAFEGYGKLSGRKLEDMEAGARVDVDRKKRNPHDFVLWKAAKTGEPSWESPWGMGRPGWHIECSAMSWKHLGETFDIHGGGKDLIFPHHENEIAQSEGAFDKPFARYWIHNGFVNINQEKMSKSLGNFLVIKDVLTRYHPEVVRLFLLSNHYRSPIDFTDKAMDEARTGLDRIYTLLDRAGGLERSGMSDGGAHWERFLEVMADDFNTAQGIGVLFEAVRQTNALLDEDPADAAVAENLSDIRRIGGILGILTDVPEDYFRKRRSTHMAGTEIDPEKIEGMIEERAQARKTKDWGRADAIRQELESMNILLEDRPDGTIWKVKQ